MKPLLNLVLLLAGVGSALLFCEFGAFPLFSTKIPLKLAPFLPERLQFLIQSSKAAMLPEDYILLVGDSYAQGSGDWLLSTDFEANGAYGSGHVLHSLLKRDVITLGRGGVGSIRGLLAYPLSTFELLKNSWRFRLKDPDFVLAYFYEGNDLIDNKREARQFLPDTRMNAELYRQTFTKVVDDQTKKAAAEMGAFGWFAPFTQLFLNLMTRHPLNSSADELDRKPGDTNRFLVAGSVVAVPDNLQSPAADLSDEDISFGLDVFEAALSYVREYFRGARLIVVYVRSPLSLYECATSEFSVKVYEGSRSRYPAGELLLKSDYLAAQVKEISRRAGAEFLDPSPRLRSVSRSALIHGPRDWKHLNQTGYEAMGAAIADYISATVSSNENFSPDN